MKRNILVYPSGSENAIEIYNSIKNIPYINVIGASARNDVSALIYRNGVEYLPTIQSENFIEVLNALIKARNIQYIFPTHDSVAYFLAQYKDQIGCEVLTSDVETNRICRFKRETYSVFKEYDFVPTVYNISEEVLNYPIISKPNVGQGSKGVRLVDSRINHEELLNSNEDLLFVEYLPGREFTVDCFTNKDGMLEFVGPRERVEIQMGISFRAIKVKKEFTKEIEEIARKINSRLNFRGMWFFQLRQDKNGGLKLLEISTRASGTSGFFRHLGVNLPLMTVNDYLERDDVVTINNYDVELFRSTQNNYKYSFDYSAVYIEFQNTLVINNQVNTDLISFIYHCRNSGKAVYLLVNSEDHFEDILTEKFISRDVFDAIITLEENKAIIYQINRIDSIIIVNRRVNLNDFIEMQIPVINVDMVSSLTIN